MMVTYDDFWTAMLESSIEDCGEQEWLDLVNAYWDEFSAKGDFSEEAMETFVETKE